ncbi:DUF4123 domain-containing protein [Aquabacterium sp.]|uniref:DUF4123 domain-containing protein n=1 Tax=Aquabacterium sp. TaxID=1872578 RepID=UPI0035B2EF19
MNEPRATGQRAYAADMRAWFASVNRPQQVFALIDLANLHHQAAQALQYIRAMGGRSILQDDREQAALASAWLVRLTHDDIGQEVFERTVVWAGQSACVTWLESALSLDELAQRLHQRTKAELPEAYAVLLRFYDPRVLPELHAVLADDLAGFFRTLGRSWVYVGRDQSVRSIVLSGEFEADGFSPPLNLDAVQFAALLSASEVDSVMPELAREAPEAFMAMPSERRASLTRRCLALADDWHLQAFAHRVMVGVLALKLGENFYQQPAWVPWIEQLRQGKINLIQAIEGATTP